MSFNWPNRLGFSGGYSVYEAHVHHVDCPREAVPFPNEQELWPGWESPLADLVRATGEEDYIEEHIVNVSFLPEDWGKYGNLVVSVTPLPTRPKSSLPVGRDAFRPLIKHVCKLLKRSNRKLPLFMFSDMMTFAERRDLLALKELENVYDVTIDIDGFEVKLLIEVWIDRKTASNYRKCEEPYGVGYNIGNVDGMGSLDLEGNRNNED